MMAFRRPRLYIMNHASGTERTQTTAISPVAAGMPPNRSYFSSRNRRFEEWNRHHGDVVGILASVIVEGKITEHEMHQM